MKIKYVDVLFSVDFEGFTINITNDTHNKGKVFINVFQRKESLNDDKVSNKVLGDAAKYIIKDFKKCVEYSDIIEKINGITL